MGIPRPIGPFDPETKSVSALEIYPPREKGTEHEGTVTFSVHWSRACSTPLPGQSTSARPPWHTVAAQSASRRRPRPWFTSRRVQATIRGRPPVTVRPAIKTDTKGTITLSAQIIGGYSVSAPESQSPKSDDSERCTTRTRLANATKRSKSNSGRSPRQNNSGASA